MRKTPVPSLLTPTWLLILIIVGGTLLYGVVELFDVSNSSTTNIYQIKRKE